MSLSTKIPESVLEASTDLVMPTESVSQHDGPPDAFHQLQEAFHVFNSASATFTEQYGRLEARIAELNLELEQANARLRRNLDEKQTMQEYLSTLLESLPVGVIGADSAGNVTSMNRCVAEILGINARQGVGKSLAALMRPDEESVRQTVSGLPPAQDVLERVIVSGFAQNETFETELAASKDDRHKVLRIRVVPSFVRKAKRKGAVVVLLIEDVTEMRRLEHQAERSSRLAAMGEIATNVAHEIRNPLGSIELFASMLQRGLAEDDTNGPLAAHICTGVRCIDHIVSNILQFARPQRLSCSAFDLNELLDETLLFTEHVLKQKQIKVERDYAEAGIALWADADLLRQMFLNLFLNAIQATPEHGTIGVRTSCSPESAEVCLWDTGCGFKADVLERIFDPFFTTRRKGTGLGLTIVHNIVRSHQGSIDAENRPEGGSLFTIQLPKRLPARFDGRELPSTCGRES